MFCHSNFLHSRKPFGVLMLVRNGNVRWFSQEYFWGGVNLVRFSTHNTDPSSREWSNCWFKNRSCALRMLRPSSSYKYSIQLFFDTSGVGSYKTGPKPCKSARGTNMPARKHNYEKICNASMSQYNFVTKKTNTLIIYSSYVILNIRLQNGPSLHQIFW